VNEKQVEKSKSSLGEDAVEMLQQAHRDALWILENLGWAANSQKSTGSFSNLKPMGWRWSMKAACL
jgi:hypothetical protein